MDFNKYLDYEATHLWIKLHGENTGVDLARS